VVLLVSSVGTVFSENPDARSRTDGASVPFLWQVESQTATLYLYGSIHVAPPSVLPPPAVVREAFYRSDVLVTEVPLGESLPLQLAEGMESRSALPEGVTLRDFYSDAEWRVVRNWAEHAGVPREPLLGLQPWVVELLAMELEGYPPEFTAENGLDVHFGAKARARGMEQVALESVEQQLDVLSGGSYEEQARSLLTALSNHPRDFDIVELFRTWQRGDTVDLAAVVRSHYSDASQAAAFERLFTNRNTAWLEILRGFLRTERAYFIVVGAGHLVGEGSVIDLLEQAGYSARRAFHPDEL
jgi:hypothetical protein